MSLFHIIHLLYAICLLLNDLGVIAQAAPDNFDWTALAPTANLTWAECYSGFQCTRFQVPLDYSQSGGSMAVIAVIRLPSQLAPSDPNYRGPIFFNPGGPGGSGVEFLVENGQAIASIAGDNFDILSFDPRGIGLSTPSVTFFDSDSDRAFWDFTSDSLTVKASWSTSSIPRLWAQSQVLGHLAQDRDNGILAHVTTDNVARDMLNMLEAYNQTNLQYWGISYGSVLGATFATLFPDRVGRLIIDGVLDMEGYFSGHWETQIIDTDKVLEIFFNACFSAGKSNCAFYAPSPGQIAHNLDALFHSVRKQPIPVYFQPTSTYTIVDFATLKYAVEQSLYSPFDSFTRLAEGLADLAVGNGTLIFEIAAASAFGSSCNSTSTNNVMESEIAVSCGDSGKIDDTPEQLEAYYASVRNISIFSDFLLPQRVRCSGWQVHGNNVFQGPTGGNTSFPLLVIGNTADPVTPARGAVRTAQNFTNSVVLIQDSPGHTSFAASSSCTQSLVRAYFQNGTLPSNGTICPVDVQLFESTANVTARSLAQDVAGVGTFLARTYKAKRYIPRI